MTGVNRWCATSGVGATAYRMGMSYVANVLRVMIASPSDTIEARDTVEAAIHGWNNANAQRYHVVLQPWRWESASVPVMGGHPQTLINAQGVDESDIVFGIFGSRLGSPTPEAVSGTVEEIERAVAQGKPVHLYFSTAPLPNDVETAQLEGLRAFKVQAEQRGLLGEFSNPSQLTHEVWKAIEHDLGSLSLTAPTTPGPVSGVKFRAQPRQEREVSGSSKNGSPRYTTRHWVEVTNVGDVDAQEVTFEAVGEEPSMMVMDGGEPTVVHSDQTRHVPFIFYGGGSGPNVLRINWRDEDERRHADFHVG